MLHLQRKRDAGRRAAASRAAVVRAWNGELRASGAAVLNEITDAEQAVGAERRDVVLGWAAAGAARRNRGEGRVGDDLDGQRAGIFAGDAHVRDLDRAPAEAVGELRALDERIAVRVLLLGKCQRRREHGSEDTQSRRSSVDLDVVDRLAVGARARSADRDAGVQQVHVAAGTRIHDDRLHVLRGRRRRRTAAAATPAAAAGQRCRDGSRQHKAHQGAAH